MNLNYLFRISLFRNQKSLGLRYVYNDGWIGGVYYLQNLIFSQTTVSVNQKIKFVIICNSILDVKSLDYIKYEHIEFRLFSNTKFISSWRTSFLKKIKYKLYNRFSINNQINVDLLLIPLEINYNCRAQKILYWIPDIQEKYLPHLFSQEHIYHRQILYKKVQNSNILFSSEAVRNDFFELFPNSKPKEYVLKFRVFHPTLSSIDYTKVLNQYSVSEFQYFICCNQFWQHKNHDIILKALEYLKSKQKTNILVLFTGKEFDFRNENHFDNLKKFITKHDLLENVKFLGLIPREDQLALIKKSIAVIQPSFCEGWSTIVEDAKALSKSIILSNIKVHFEQMGENGIYINPNDKTDLANKMVLAKEQFCDFSKNHHWDYDSQRHDFGENLFRIVSDVCKS